MTKTIRSPMNRAATLAIQKHRHCEKDSTGNTKTMSLRGTKGRGNLLNRPNTIKKGGKKIFPPFNI
jgi:hypothetical protein